MTLSCERADSVGAFVGLPLCDYNTHWFVGELGMIQAKLDMTTELINTHGNWVCNWPREPSNSTRRYIQELAVGEGWDAASTSPHKDQE